MDCGKISAGFVAGACGKLPTGGTGTHIVLINYADISGVTYAETTGAITAITLASNAKGYLFETIESSALGECSFEKGTYVSQYTHQVTMRVFKDTIAARKFVNDLTEARLVAIVERREAGEAHWEVYGIESGLKMSDNPTSTDYSDNVVFAPVLASDDVSKESKVPAVFYDGTSAASTTAAVLALVAE